MENVNSQNMQRILFIYTNSVVDSQLFFPIVLSYSQAFLSLQLAAKAEA